MRLGAKSAWVLFGLTSAFVAAPAAGADHVRLRNNLIPGFRTEHRISRLIRRTSQQQDYLQTATYSRRSDWIRCNVDESQPGRVKVFHMMVDTPPKVLRVFHDDERVRPTPDATEFSLLSGSPSLRSAVITPRDAPLEVLPITEAAERAVLAALLDFAHWPAKRVDAGHRWQRDINIEGFSGTQTFEFVDLAKLDGQVAARLTLFVEGEFTGALGQNYALEKAQAVIHWYRMNGTLARMEGQATYGKKRDDGQDTYELKLDVKLRRQRQLSEQEQDAVVRQLNAFAEALTRFQGGDRRGAVRACRAFEMRWPDAVWLPAVRSLAERAASRKKGSRRISTKELNRLLAKSVVAWQAARAKGDTDLLTRTRRALVALARDQRSRLKTLTKTEDAGLRSRAVFALAFSDRPADLALLQKAVGDESPLVRAMALTGLAARRSPRTDPRALIAALPDTDARVRLHACEAIAACISRENAAIVECVKGVTRAMSGDKSAAVRLAAVRALTAIGSRADIAPIENARKMESVTSIRDAMDRTLRVLRDRE